jgi:YHS domain-containing protein
MTELLWILFYVGLFYFMFRYGGCCGGHATHGRHGGRDIGGDASSHDVHDSSGGTVLSASRDPVCGMVVSDGSYSRIYRGREYRFCSKACMDRFDNDADQYAVEERRAS